MSGFEKYMSKAREVSAFRWDGDDLPQSLLLDERIRMVIAGGVKCLEVAVSSNRSERCWPGEYIIDKETGYEVVNAERFEKSHELLV